VTLSNINTLAVLSVSHNLFIFGFTKSISVRNGKLHVTNAVQRVPMGRVSKVNEVNVFFIWRRAQL